MIPRYGAVGLILLCLPVIAAAQAPVGVIFDAPAGAHADAGAIQDAVVAGLSAVEGYNVVVLHDESPLLAAWDVDPSRLQAARGEYAVLPQLAATLQFDEIFHIALWPADETWTVSIVAAAAEYKHLRTLDLDLAATGRGAMDQVAGQITGAVESGAMERVDAADIAAPSPERPAARQAPDEAETTTKPAPANVAPEPEDTVQPPVAETVSPGPDDGEPPVTEIVPAQPQQGPETVGAPYTDVEESGADNKEPPQDSPQADGTHVQKARRALVTGDRDLALRHMEAAIETGEPDGAIYLLKADMARFASDHVAERKWLQRAAATTTHGTRGSLRLAALLADQGLWHRAIETYERILQSEPGRVEASTGMAGVLRDLDRPRQAAKVLSEAVNHHPDDYDLRVRLGDAYRDAGMLTEAEEAYDLVARSGDRKLRAEVFDRLGDLYVEAGRYEEGFYCYAEAARLQTDGDAPLSPKRYRQVMSTADEAVLAAMQNMRKTYESYAVYEDIPREAAYGSAEKTVAQLEEVSKFARSITPPDGLKRMHLQRRLFYSVSLEAAVSLMTYLDTNLDVARKQYEDTARRIDDEYRALQSAGG